MLYIVIGPPAGGKSTYVREHAKPGDIAIDYDALANTLTPAAKGSHEHTKHVKAVTKAARQAAIDTALQRRSATDVYIIHSTPSPQLLRKYRSHGARIITIDPGRDVVEARARVERPWWMQGAIKRWYDEHTDQLEDQDDMPSNPNRGGQKWRTVRDQFRRNSASRNSPCVHCNQPIDYDAAPQTTSAFEADHHQPVDTHPELAYDITNLRASHSSCNRSRGSKPAEPEGAWVAAEW